MTDVQKAETEVLVFKTNISDSGDLGRISSVLRQESRIRKWNLDSSDIDNVLRIESRHLDPHEVIEMIRQSGFMCEELPD